MSAGHDTMSQPPTPEGAQVSPLPLAALRLSQAPWTADESGQRHKRTPMIHSKSHMAKCRGRSNLQSCFHIKRQTRYFYLHPTGPSTCPTTHTFVLEKCLNGGSWGTKKRTRMWKAFGGPQKKRYKRETAEFSN